MLHQPLNPLQIRLRCRQIGLRNLTGGIAIGSEDFLALLQSLLTQLLHLLQLQFVLRCLRTGLQRLDQPLNLLPSGSNPLRKRLALPAGLPQHLCLRTHHIHLCERLPLHRLGQPGSEHLLMRCKAFLVLRRLHPRHARNHNRAHHHGGHAQPQLLRHAQMGHPALLVFGHQNLSSSAKARPC